MKPFIVSSGKSKWQLDKIKNFVQYVLRKVKWRCKVIACISSSP